MVQSAAHDEARDRVNPPFTLHVANSRSDPHAGSVPNIHHQLRRLEKALEAMQMGVTVTDVAGTIVYTNSADATMHGFLPEELIGEDIGVLSPQGLRAPLTVQELRSLTSWRRLSWNVRKDGSVFPVQLLSDVVTDETGEPIGIVTTCEDITERRREEAELRRTNVALSQQQQVLENSLRQAQKLEAVGQLTSGIAHDFNNMLSVILANAEMLKAALPDHAELQAHAEDILAAGRDGAHIVSQLLGFSRQAELRMRPIDLQKLVVEQSSMLQHLIAENIEIHTYVGTPLKPVKADRTAVQQILMNVVTNARDAMPQGGAIRIEASAAQLDDSYQATHPWVEPGEYLCLAVSDTGVGMTKTTLDRIFEPFFTTKPPGQGTGLGMPMIYGLMKQHSGFVHVYSEVGEGTTVKLYFPMVAAIPANEVQADLTAPLGTGTETILLVEDEEVLRRTAGRALTKFGYTVITATNGAEGLSLYREHRGEIDLVISDIVMPKLSGRDLYEAIQREGGAVKFMFASGYSARDAQERARLDPTLPFLRKPWTLLELAHQVRATLDGQAL